MTDLNTLEGCQELAIKSLQIETELDKKTIRNALGLAYELGRADGIDNAIKVLISENSKVKA